MFLIALKVHLRSAGGRDTVAAGKYRGVQIVLQGLEFTSPFVGVTIFLHACISLD